MHDAQWRCTLCAMLFLGLNVGFVAWMCTRHLRGRSTTPHLHTKRVNGLQAIAPDSLRAASDDPNKLVDLGSGPNVSSLPALTASFMSETPVLTKKTAGNTGQSHLGSVDPVDIVQAVSCPTRGNRSFAVVVSCCEYTNKFGQRITVNREKLTGGGPSSRKQTHVPLCASLFPFKTPR